MLNIGGYQKVTLLDYPEKISCLIFFQGCNFNCNYCHNKDLIYNKNTIIDKNIIIDYLKKRKHVLEGVCISGGEPTLYPDLVDFIKEIKDIGYDIKLDTNGTNPEMIDYLIKNNLINYIAMDIKNSKDKYNITSNCNTDISNIDKSINIILEKNIDYEFRTTVIKEFHDLNDFRLISEWIKEADKYYLQKYRKVEKVELTPPSDEFLLEAKLILIMNNNIKNIYIR